MATAEEIQAKIDKLDINMDRFNSIVNGSITASIPVDIGNVPSIRKFYSSVEIKLGNQLDTFLQEEVYNQIVLPAIEARDIAAGYASDAVSQGNVPIYGTVAGMVALSVPEGINAIRINGGTAAGDGNGGLFVDQGNGRAVSFVTSGPGSRPWYRADDSIGAAVWTGGTFRTMQERARDTYCILDAPGGADRTGVNESTSSFEAMIAEGVKCEVVSGNFVLTRKLAVPDGVTIEGQGRGYEFGHKTKLLFAGTGAKANAIPGATATVVANPDAGAAYLADSGTRGNNYSTLDLTASFSAAVILGKASGLKGLGIYPNFDGVAGYLGSDGRMSDDWDVGVWARNSDWWNIEDCNVIGHWRKAGLLVSAHDIGDGKVPSNEIGHAIRSHFQGARGVSIRSPETVVGSNYGFAGTDFINCLIRGLWHQSGHLATSSFLSTPLDTPSGCLEISGGIMRGVQFLNDTFIGRDDMLAFFGKCSEIQFDGCYEEGKGIRVNGAALANSDGARMVATSGAVGVEFKGNSQYMIDFSPSQTRDSSLSGKRYGSAGVFNPATHYDSDYTERVFSSYIGHRARKSTDRFIFEDENGVARTFFNADGRIQSAMMYSGLVTVANGAAISIPTPRNGGQCAITNVGGGDASLSPSVSHTGIVAYDTGSTPSCAKIGGSATFAAVTGDVTGATGTAGNTTVGVVQGSVRLENQTGGSASYRYTFF